MLVKINLTAKTNKKTLNEVIQDISKNYNVINLTINEIEEVSK